MFPVEKPLNPKLINLSTYEEGYRARMQGESLTIFSDWTDASWRTGWSDAGKDLTLDPDLLTEPKPQSPLDLKGYK